MNSFQLDSRFDHCLITHLWPCVAGLMLQPMARCGWLYSRVTLVFPRLQVTPRPVVPHWGNFTIQETFDDIWGHFWLAQLNDLMASSGDRNMDDARHPSMHRTEAPQLNGGAKRESPAHGFFPLCETLEYRVHIRIAPQDPWQAWGFA